MNEPCRQPRSAGLCCTERRACAAQSTSDAPAASFPAAPEKAEKKKQHSRPASNQAPSGPPPPLRFTDSLNPHRALPSGDPNGEFPASPPLPSRSPPSARSATGWCVVSVLEILRAAPAASPNRPPLGSLPRPAPAPRGLDPTRRAVLRPCARAEGGALFSVGWSIWVSVFFLGVVPPITWVSRVCILCPLSRQFGHLQSTISH